MSALVDLVARGTVVPRHNPWPRSLVDVEAWKEAIAALVAGDLTMLGLWGEVAVVHMALA